MRRLFGNLTSGVVLIVFLMSVSGCVPLLIGAAAGAGGMAYIKGTLEQTFENSTADLHKAAVRGLRDLKTQISSDQLSQHAATVKFEFDDGAKGTLTIKALTERSARLRIHIGILGDELKSQMVLNAILRHL